MIRKYAEIVCCKNVSSFSSAKATHIFSAKNIRISCIESARTVNEMTLNKLVKLTTLWTTGSWSILIYAAVSKQSFFSFEMRMLKLAITKTCLYNFDPLKPHFYLVKLGFTGVYIIFLIPAQNIDCGYSLEPPRRGGSNEYPHSMFWAEILKISEFFIWKFSFFSW